MTQGAYIVADFGKTLAKLTLWSRAGECLARETRPNAVGQADGFAALDVAGVGEWLVETLEKFAAHPVEAIIPVAHGAAVVAIHDGEVAFPPMDYEQAIPDDVMAAYRAQRDPFAVTGSPAFPQGLNFGSQLHWLERLVIASEARQSRRPAADSGLLHFARNDSNRFEDLILLPYAQYWAWFLSGVATSEATSLGCHSDLWAPSDGDFSPMAKRRGWAAQFAPLVKASDVIGTLCPELAARTGLSPTVRIHAGLHDSNAALIAARGFPEIDGREATVLSTGTWFVAMRTPGKPVDLTGLPEGRDCLINVDANGQPVPSARFMGGREIETLIELDTRRVDIKPDQPALLAAVSDVIESGAMLLPTFAPGFGPFPHGEGRWINRPEDLFASRAAACLYAALVADTSLSLIGAKEVLLVEGRFAEAEVFVRALASLRPDMAVLVANALNDVSFGALRLIDPALRPEGALRRVAPLDQDLSGYRAEWKKRVEGQA